MKTKEIKYDKDGLKLRVVVGKANVRQGIVRTILRQQASAQYSGELDENFVIAGTQLFHILTFPDIIAGTFEIEGLEPWPPSLETILELPEDLLIEWETLVYEMNPHWLPTKEVSPKVKGRTKGSTPESFNLPNTL